MKRNSVTLAITMAIAIIWTFYPTTTSVAEAPEPPKPTPKEYAKAQLEYRGYLGNNWACLSALWGKESAWNHLADNPESSAFGIAQRLGETSTDPYTQIDYGLKYIEARYGSPCNAWAFFKKRNWY